jgi:hypothetical protein
LLITASNNKPAVANYSKQQPRQQTNMKIIIKDADNGYIIEKIYEDEKDVFVIEDNDDEQELTKKLLETIAELTGVTYDKWGKNNLSITFDKEGHKYCG